jgi:hypothetical protein
MKTLLSVFSVLFVLLCDAQNISNAKQMGSSSVINTTPCVNEGFESTLPGQYTSANAVPGWTLESSNNGGLNGVCYPSTVALWSSPNSEFWIRQTPVTGQFLFGTIGTSPFGGSMIAQLQNATPSGLMTRISTTFPVTVSNNLFEYAFAGTWEGSHACCDNAFSKVEVYNCTGALLSCFTMSVNSSSLCTTGNTFSSTSGITWTNWQVRSIDLSPFIGSCVTIRVMAGDCDGATHAGSMFFDSRCRAQLLPPGFTAFGTGMNQVNYCWGSNQALLYALSGYQTYTFVPPTAGPTISPAQATVSPLVVNNPIPYTSFSVSYSTASGCIFTQSLMIAPTSVSIAAISTSGSCVNGTSGSAAVLGTGSGTGYNYIWTNSTNSVVSTSSVANNLPPGTYSVNISAIGFTACGNAAATVSISTNPTALASITKPFCGNTAYLTGFSGSNFQWYNNFTPISPGAGGTAPAYTVTNAINNSTYVVAYTTPQGCRDSLGITVSSVVPGSINTISNPPVCLNSNNGSAIFSLTPAQGSAGNNSFAVVSTGTTTAFSASQNPTTFSSYSVTGLSSNGTYSVRAFDGACVYSLNFSVNTINFDYTLTVFSATACQGNPVPAGVNFSFSPNSNYNYSWSPASLLTGGVSTLQTAGLTPTVSPGSQSQTIYTVMVTPVAANCPITKTLVVTVANPLTPNLNSLPPVCNNGPTLQLTGNPPGGVYGGTGVNAAGVITPSLVSPGSIQFSYTTFLAGCPASAVTILTVMGLPQMSVIGPSVICSGATANLILIGAASYSWNGTASATSISVSPQTTTTYTLSGTALNGCIDDIPILMNVTPSPTISVSGNPDVCAGNSTTLAASGAQSYTWVPGGTGPTIIYFIPTTSSVIVLTGVNSGTCFSSQTISLNVHPNPTLQVTGKSSVCAGESVTLAASGASTYFWQPGGTGGTITVKPTVNTIYVVTGSTSANCTGSKTFVLNVSTCSGIEEMIQNGRTVIFPNPTSGVLNVHVQFPAVIKIYSQTGILIIEKKLNPGVNLLDASSATPGIYHAVVFSDQDTEHFNLVKE